MEKILLTLLVLFMAVLPGFSEHVIVQTAQRAAQSFLNSKMESEPQIHLIDFAEKASFPNFYVFGNERCFVIVSADDGVHPVLGYSTENAFVTENIPENTFDWLRAYDEEISFVGKYRLTANDEIRSEWENLLGGKGLAPKSGNSVHPLLTTCWNQGAPFNSLCPVDSGDASGHVRTGCVATAMAQVMNYWEHPISGDGSKSYNLPLYGDLYANFEETTYDWDNMRNCYSIQGYSDEEALAVATLMYHCGVSIEIGYGSDGSTGYLGYAADAFKTYFDYSTDIEFKYKTYGNTTYYTDSQWIGMLKAELDLERPLPYRSTHDDINNPIGHSFVCDGYDESDYFHFNWGWAGKDDGYFLIGALNPISQTSPYNRDNAAIFNCYPNTPSINPPSSVTTTISERNVTVDWTMVSNASSYKLYRDGNLIANNLTSGIYVDQNVTYGEHFYYVKSVKSDGTMSLRSDKAVVDIHFSGPAPTNLQALVNGQDVNLTWQPQTPETSILQYAVGNPSGYTGNNTATYWAHRYPASTLCDYAGMAISKVSNYFKRAGAYTLSIYKGCEMYPTELLHQQNYTARANSWQDVVFTNPIPIDFTQDLWIVFSSTLTRPASYRYYSGPDVGNASLYCSNGDDWRCLNDRSWLMKTYLTDGTYTYNLYCNGNAVATNLSGNTYTDSNLPEGMYDYHVTTNYFGGESDLSNTVNVQIMTPTTQMTNLFSGWNWWSTDLDITLDDLKAALVEALPGTVITINSMNSGSIFYNGNIWRGQLNLFDVTQSYMIKTEADCQIILTGFPVTPSEHPVTIHNGNNRIGFPLNESMSLTNAFAGFAVNGDMVISQFGSSTYNGVFWRGSFSTLEHGQGYIYKSKAQGDRVFTFPMAK